MLGSSTIASFKLRAEDVEAGFEQPLDIQAEAFRSFL